MCLEVFKGGYGAGRKLALADRYRWVVRVRHRAFAAWYIKLDPVVVVVIVKM